MMRQTPLSVREMDSCVNTRVGTAVDTASGADTCCLAAGETGNGLVVPGPRCRNAVRLALLRCAGTGVGHARMCASI